MMSAALQELAGQPENEEHLRGDIRDQVSLAALSSGWVHGEPASTADELAYSLQAALGAGFVYVQVRPSSTGGIIEAEFLIQTLQMRRKLWEPNWSEAMTAVAAAGYLAGSESGGLEHSTHYRARSESDLRGPHTTDRPLPNCGDGHE